jgi:hypothetical protein
MERERQHPGRSEAGGGGTGPEAELDEHRERVLGLTSAADKLMASINARDAEEYLQQSKQRSAQ